MGKAQIRIIGIVLIITIVIGLLFIDKKDTTKDEIELNNQKLISTLEDENIIIKMENSYLNNSINSFEAKNNTLNSIIEEQVTIIKSVNNNEFNEQFIILPLYTADDYTHEIKTNYYITVSKNATLLEKLDTIAIKLSEYSFNGLPIDVISIDNIDEKKVAVVRLGEAEENIGVTDLSQFRGQTWKMHYFQGSSGGFITSTILVESFLQRYLEEEWIDGVLFKYDGQNVGTDHVSSIFEINYRK